MRLQCLACSIICLFSFICVIGQENNSKDEVRIFTQEERDNMQLWFYNRATTMGLVDDIRSEYYNIILYYSYKMERLDDKDKRLDPEELRAQFEVLIKKQHEEIKAILTDEQYVQYLKKYALILNSVFERNGWNKN